MLVELLNYTNDGPDLVYVDVRTNRVYYRAERGDLRELDERLQGWLVQSDRNQRVAAEARLAATQAFFLQRMVYAQLAVDITKEWGWASEGEAA